MPYLSLSLSLSLTPSLYNPAPGSLARRKKMLMARGPRAGTRTYIYISILHVYVGVYIYKEEKEREREYIYTLAGKVIEGGRSRGGRGFLAPASLSRYQPMSARLGGHLSPLARGPGGEAVPAASVRSFAQRARSWYVYARVCVYYMYMWRERDRERNSRESQPASQPASERASGRARSIDQSIVNPPRRCSSLSHTPSSSSLPSTRATITHCNT